MVVFDSRCSGKDDLENQTEAKLSSLDRDCSRLVHNGLQPRAFLSTGLKFLKKKDEEFV